MAGDPLLIPPLRAFEPVRLLSRPTDERPQEPQMGSKEESRIIPPENLVSGTKTVVIGACAPIHPRVGPAVRPDVPIRADLLLFLRPSPRAHRGAAADAEGRTRRDRGHRFNAAGERRAARPCGRRR